MPGAVIRARAKVQGAPYEVIIRTAIDDEGDSSYIIIGLVKAGAPPKRALEVDAATRSLQLPPAPPPPLELPSMPIAIEAPAEPASNAGGRNLRTMAPAELAARAQDTANEGDYAAAVQFGHWAVAGGAPNKYSLACYYARAGQIDGAIHWLERAVEDGVDASWAERDGDLQSVRADPRWNQIRAFLRSAARYWAASKLSLRVGAETALDVRSFRVEERMSSLFTIEIVAVSRDHDIDFEAVVGQPAMFAVQGLVGEAPSRKWTGVCRSIRQLRVEDRGVSTYAIEIVPALWLLTQRRNYRMFQQLSELEIATRLLEPWGIHPELRIGEQYKKRKYRVQYGESDFAFFSRMLEEAGISFFFADRGGETTLVLTDEPSLAPVRTPGLAFVDNETAAQAGRREVAYAVRICRRIRPGLYSVRDHDYRRPPSYKLMTSAVASATDLERDLESFEYSPGAFLFESAKGESTPNADDKGRHRTDDVLGARLTERRLQATRGDAMTCTFATNAADLGPGSVVALLDHPRRDLGEHRPLLIVACTRSGEIGEEWTTECEAVGAEISYRPPLSTPKPRADGVESATVVGPPGEEIHTDEFGRVRVHFHWDRESKMDDDSSCWIHVSQPWGGAGYGGTALPRVGQEVIVDFLNADPDRPVIVGRVFTNLQRTPYPLPANKTQSGMRSNSTTGTGGYNELMFEDAAGRELVRVQAERDYNKLVKHDEIALVGNDRSRKVVRDEYLEIGNDRTKIVTLNEAVEIGATRTKKIGKDEHVLIGQDRSQRVVHDESVVVGNDRAREVGANESITIAKNRSKNVGQNELVKIGKSYLRTIAASEIVKIGKSLSQTVNFSSSERVGFSKSFMVGKSMSTSVGFEHSVTAGREASMAVHPPLGGGAPTKLAMKKDKIVIATSGGASIILEGTTITLKAKEIVIAAEDKLTASSTKEASLAGATKVNVSSKSGEVAITGGPLVSINGPGKPAGRLLDPAPAMITNGSATSQIGGPSLPFDASPADKGDIRIGKNIYLHGTPQFQSAAMARLGQIGATKSGMAMLNTINNGKYPVTIMTYAGPNSVAIPFNALDAMPKGSILMLGGNAYTGTGVGSGTTVQWNPDLVLHDANGGPEQLSPDTILFHELTHATHNMTGTADFNSLGGGWTTAEERATELTGSPNEADYLRDTGFDFHRIDHDSHFAPNAPPPGGHR